MSAETELLVLKLSAQEAFMGAVAKKLKCLPSFADPLPTGGNRHIMNRLDELLGAVAQQSDNTAALNDDIERVHSFMESICLNDSVSNAWKRVASAFPGAANNKQGAAIAKITNDMESVAWDYKSAGHNDCGAVLLGFVQEYRTL